MITQSKGKIFLADERGLNETDWFRSYNTFNFGRYQSEHKSPFGSLYVLNEDTLAGQKSLNWLVEEDTDVILLPVVGAIEFKTSTGDGGVIEAGTVQVLSLPAGTNYEVKNPYQDDLVKYLQLWVNVPAANQQAMSCQNSFDLDTYQLTELFGNDASQPRAYTGAIIKLDGRQEDTYHKKHPDNGIFVYAIQGALEVQYRLMHEGDGLGLWEINDIEFEALSNDAILLIMEVPV